MLMSHLCSSACLVVACCDEPKVNESTDKSTAALSSTNSFLSVIYLFFTFGGMVLEVSVHPNW